MSAWPWSAAARRQFEEFGVRAFAVSEGLARAKLEAQADATGSAFGVHVGRFLFLPRDPSVEATVEFVSGVLHELAHAAVWCLGGRAGTSQWGLGPWVPWAEDVERDVACVHIYLVGGFRLGARFDVSALHGQYVAALGIAGSLEEAVGAGHRMFDGARRAAVEKAGDRDLVGFSVAASSTHP